MAWFDIASNAPWLVNQPSPGQSLAQGAQVGGIISAAMGRRAALQEEARQFDAKMSYQERLEAQTADSVGRMIQDLQAAPTTTDQLNVVNRYAPLAVTPAGDRALGLVGQMLRAKAGVETATARAAAAKAKTDAQSMRNKTAWDLYGKLSELAPELVAMLESNNDSGVIVDQKGTKVPLYTPEGNWTGTGLSFLYSAVEKSGGLGPTPAKPAAEKYLDLADKEAAEAEAARASGDVAGFQMHNERSQNYRQLAAPRGTSTEVTFGPGGQVSGVRLEAGPKPTTAMSTRAQEKTVNYENAIGLINQLQKQLSPGDVGFRGFLGEIVVDKLLAQLNPQWANLERIDARTALGALRESLLRQVSDDPRFSNVDRKAISDILPSSGVVESYPDAIKRMNRVRQIFADRIREYSEATRSPLADAAKTAAQITAEYESNKAAIISQGESGKLTEEQVNAALRQLYDRASDALKRYH